MIERILRHVGRYDVQAVGSGADALQVAQSNQPDVVVLDISMADMDGITTLHELRAQGLRCPVIAYTARAERAPGEFVAQGFDAYVSKNGNLSNLLSTIRDVLPH
ncbi:response regulator [Candidatus Gracilibacteria bacterium]|nr:response regulator [Candidatus Gracilibacteria bacterium]